MTLIIRAEKPEDIPAINAVIQAAFLDHPHSSHNEHDIVVALRNSSALSVSLVVEKKTVEKKAVEKQKAEKNMAEQNCQIVGHIAFSPVNIAGVQNWYGLGPVAVAPAAQRQGIGSQLINTGLQYIKSLHADGCVLVGNPAYYSRFGFVANPSLNFPGVPSEYLLALHFRGPEPFGEVRYHSVFYGE